MAECTGGYRRMTRGPGRAAAVLVACTLLVAVLVLSTALRATGSESAQDDADEAGTITITASEGNEDVSYNAWLVFAGDVQDGQVVDVQWASDEMRETVLAVLYSCDAAYEDDSDASASAQHAAEYIAASIGDADGTAGGSTPSQDPTVVASATSFAAQLADAVDELDATATLEPGQALAVQAGWWLICTDTQSIGQGASGTSPIFTMAGGSAGAVQIVEKTGNVPTVTKTVVEDSTGTYGKAADAHTGQSVTYRIEGSVAANIASYSTYSYAVHDELAGGTIDANSVVVSHVASDASVTDVTALFSVTVDGSTLDASCDDLLAIEDVDAASIIRVEYTASLDASAQTGAAGNANCAYVTYSNNPNTSSTGRTASVTTQVYTYTLAVCKADASDTSQALEGAAFTLQVAQDNTDAGSAGLYVQQDGSLAKSAYEFSTDAQGSFQVSGIDEGVYVLSETQAPTGDDGVVYACIEDTTFTLVSNSVDVAADSTAGTQLELSAQVDGDEGVAVSGIDADGGVIELTVLDESEQAQSTVATSVPQTGVAGAAGVLALAAFAAAGWHVARVRRRSHVR